MDNNEALVTLVRPTTRQGLPLPIVHGGGCTLGSGALSDVLVEGDDVAAAHARLSWDDGTLMLEPIGQAAVAVNGTPVQGPTPVTAGDWLALGSMVFQVAVKGAAAGREPTGEGIPPARPIVASGGESAAPRRIIAVGRLTDNDVTIDSPVVSRRHARLLQEGDRWVLEDLASTNGTFVNARRVVDRVVLNGGERIEFGGFAYVLAGDGLREVSGAGTVRIEARGLGKTVTDAATGRPRSLLSGIDLAVLPGEFVGIFGTSGSGKSTLMDALNGRRPGTEGAVLYNGQNLSRSFDSFRAVIGYVPQQDIVHRRITIRHALQYTARLRLPDDTSEEEIEEYIRRVLERVGLPDKADQPIDTPVPLSGGQLKRVSVAVELVSNPAVLFLDEATSGLDAGTDRRMMQLFAELAGDRKTVVCVTHTLENIDACHLVVVLFRGRMVYFGPPAGVCEHFEIRRLSDVYDALESRPAEHWAERYGTSGFAGDYVHRRLSAVTGPAMHPASTATLAPQRPRAPGVRQTGILTRRYVDLIRSDRRNLVILLAQAPVIGAVVGLVFRIGDTLAQRAVAESQIAFMLVISAVWFGCLNSAREIVKELPIYARERSVNLGIVPYVTSKVLPLAVLCAVQCAALLAVVGAFLSIPGDPWGRGALLFATGMAATGMGLAISAFVTSTDKAVAMVPIILIPQVILSNAVVRLEGGSQYVARAAIIAFWGYDGMKATLGEDVRAAADPAGALLVPVLMSYATAIGRLGFLFVVFLAGTVLALKARDRTS